MAPSMAMAKAAEASRFTEPRVSSPLPHGNTGMGGTWKNPTSVYTPRFVRLNFTVIF